MWVVYKPVDVEIDDDKREKKWDDHIHSFHAAFQIPILILSSNICTSLPLASKQVVKQHYWVAKETVQDTAKAHNFVKV